ncbi:GGDEF domain-containing protein [Fundidesulfovibrio terrae]|uniref:GGDEF domain-containing protein n=1 Tax=Fundidesulfovibrio terrae TaxID=2922866 RepID=UPI001FAFE29F|nr:diguanylate cyclase [Fundidesulfovibrio terrae]
MFQFSQVRESLTEFGGNWMPTVQAAGALMRMNAELRRLELLGVLADSDGDIARASRRMARQRTRIIRADTEIEPLLATSPERDAFRAYRTAQSNYLALSRRIAAMKSDGLHVEATVLAREAAPVFATMTDSLQLIEQLNMDYGRQAEDQATRRFAIVVRTLVAAGAANILVAVSAALLAARRISRPIARLAECMDEQESDRPRCLLPDPSPAVREVSVLYSAFRNLTGKLAASMAKLEDMAVTDQLTGLSNRRRLMDEGSKIMALCRRGGRPCSALMLDLDHFKAVNDTYGHAAGDAVLAHVAGVLRREVRESDVLARYGGEEFAVLAPDCDLEMLLHLAERLRAAVEENLVDIGTQPLAVTVSIGAAAASGDDRDLATVLARADKALYAAKTGGRNRVVSCAEAD